MKIGIDLDNVLNNMTEQLVNECNKVFNEGITIEDIKSYDIASHLKCGVDIYKYFIDDEFLRNLMPLPYSQEVTERLSKEHKLYIVTASQPESILEKSKWLTKYFPHIQLENLITIQDKSLVDVDVLIDDAIHNIIEFPRYTITMDYAWNRSLKVGYRRAKNWLEIEKIINKLNEGSGHY